MMKAFVITCLAAAAAAAQGPSDAVLRGDVQRRINALKLDSGKVMVSVEGHIVMLDGRVPTLSLKRQAIDAARKTPGVETVQSTLTIIKAESDDQLAFYVTRAITGYPRYTVFDYIEGSVKDGAATLIGAVTTEQKLGELRG